MYEHIQQPSINALSKGYGLNIQTIYNILQYKTWKIN